MEQWLKPPGGDEMGRLVDMARSMPFDIWCARISEMTEEKPPREAYAQLHTMISCFWHGMRATEPLVEPLVRLCYGLEVVGPTPFKPMEPDLEEGEAKRRLNLLDTGRRIFKRRLLEGFRTIPPIGVRNLVIRWARIQYECRHCFQAPPRFDPKQAVRDAMGDSDHFREMMEEVIREVDGEFNE